MRNLLLLIGTRKGAFIARTDRDRRNWDLSGPFFAGAEVNDVNLIPGDPPRIVVAGKSNWWGPDLRWTSDLGDTWSETTGGIRFDEGRGHTVNRIWVVESDPHDPTRLFAGVDPGALFSSTNAGESWSEVTSLTEHPTRAEWFPGGGGLMVHCVAVDPANRGRIFLAISAAGVFRSDDGGATWTPKNRGVRADFLPNKQPEVGQCAHHLEMHPSNPSVLYQQNHCGVYRSEDAGESWTDLCEGLPGRFGFPLAVHPHDGDTIYVIPEESDERRMTPGGAFRIFRSRNRGNSWEALTNGLPQTGAYQNVLRMAMATDTMEDAGIYVGTQGGHVVASRNGGDRWDVIFNWLPPVYSLRTAVLD